MMKKKPHDNIVMGKVYKKLTKKLKNKQKGGVENNSDELVEVPQKVAEDILTGVFLEAVPRPHTE